MAKYGDAFRKAASPKADKPASNGKTPTVDASSIAIPLAKFVKAKSDEKDALARKAEAEAGIMDFGNKARREQCRKDGKEMSSVMLDGGEVELAGKTEHPIVRFTAKNNYKIHQPDAVREAFGKEYDQYFVEQNEVKLKDAAILDPKILAKLIKVCGTRLSITIDPTVLQDDSMAGKVLEAIGGADNIGTYFDVAQTVKATERFHSELVLNESIAAKAAPLFQSEAIRNDKPTLKES